MSDLIARFETGRFLVLVSPPANDPALVAAAVEAGADGAKCHLNVEHRASGRSFGPWSEERSRVLEMLAAAGDRPLGVMPGAATLPTPAEFDELEAAGLAFFDLYFADMPPWLWERRMTRMVALGAGQGPAQAAALAPRGAQVLEASVVPPAGYGEPLAPADLAAYRALAAATPLPMIVPSQRALVPADLPRLAAAGARGVLLGTLSLGGTPAEFEGRLPAFVASARASRPPAVR